MNRLKDTVIGYLNMGLHPTVVSYPDDGLYYLFDKLLQETTTSNSYDPTFTFVHVSISHLEPDITTEKIENEILNRLKFDKFEGDTVFETYRNDVETVCVLDDLAFIDDVPKAINVADTLIKKYRGILHFVYVVEDPLLVPKLKGKIPASSTFLDAIMHKRIGEYWEPPELNEMCEKQFKKTLSAQETAQISELSNNHLGTYKRLYKDKVLNLNSAERYANLMIENLDNSLLSVFKKAVNGLELQEEEKEILQHYKKVGFIEDNKINIPLISKVIEGAVINNKLEFNDSKQELQGYDMHLFTKAERDIIQALFISEEIISKEQLGTIIWRSDIDEKYSEWAIDQRIARLRKKLIDVGMNIDIQTVYGKGYKLVYINKSSL